MLTVLLVKKIEEGGWCRYTGTYSRDAEEWFAWAKDSDGKEFILSSRQSLEELKEHIRTNYTNCFGVYDFTEYRL